MKYLLALALLFGLTGVASADTKFNFNFGPAYPPPRPYYYPPPRPYYYPPPPYYRPYYYGPNFRFEYRKGR
jgi:hypothetical protein